MSNQAFMQAFQWGWDTAAAGMKNNRESKGRAGLNEKLGAMEVEADAAAKRAVFTSSGSKTAMPTDMPMVETAVNEANATPAIPAAAPASAPALPAAAPAAAQGALPVAAPTPTLTPVAAPAAQGALPVGDATAQDTGAAMPSAAGAIPNEAAAKEEAPDPRLLQFAELSGLMAQANLPADESQAVLTRFHALGNKLMVAQFQSALADWGKPQGGRAIRDFMMANDPDANYTMAFDPQSESYVFVDRNSDNPEGESFVVSQNWANGMLAAATDGKAPIFEFNKGVQDHAAKMMKLQTDGVNADTAASIARVRRDEADEKKAQNAFSNLLDAGKFQLDVEKWKSATANDFARLNLDTQEFDLKASDVRQAVKAGAGTGLDVDDLVSLQMLYKSSPSVNTSIPVDKYMGLVSRIMTRDGVDVFVASNTLAGAIGGE